SDRSEIVDRHVSGAGDVRQEDSIRLDDHRSAVVLPLQNGCASRVSTASTHILDAHESLDVGVFEPVFGDAGREVEPSPGEPAAMAVTRGGGKPSLRSTSGMQADVDAITARPTTPGR